MILNQIETKLPINKWAEDDRPREKLLHKGTDSLSNSELLAILIATGNGQKSAIDLAKDVLLMINNNLSMFSNLSIKQLQQVKGIGEAKAITIVAAMEFGKRVQSASLSSLMNATNCDQVGKLLQCMYAQYAHEIFAIVYLNTANKILCHEVISEGGLQGTIVDIRMIFKNALLHNATGIILCHNHPSGNLQPSKADIDLTIKIKEAGSLMQILVVDHFIVSKSGFYSFANEGKL